MVINVMVGINSELSEDGITDKTTLE